MEFKELSLDTPVLSERYSPVTVFPKQQVKVNEFVLIKQLLNPISPEARGCHTASQFKCDVNKDQ